MATRLDALTVKLSALQVSADQDVISPSIRLGVALFPEDGETSRILLDKAMSAMALATQNRSKFEFFKPEIQRAVLENRKLVQSLRGAIERNELAMHYQPIVCLKTSALHTFEALLRWTHPTMGSIPPDRFIPLAERNGLIISIGDWVVREVVKQAIAWSSRGVSDVTVSLNVSAVQLHDIHFANRVGKILSEYGWRPGAVKLAVEITESHMLEDIEVCMAQFDELRALGMTIIVDDFGTGYSSLNYLHRLPINAFKIDKSFVRHLHTDAQEQRLVGGIVALAASLGLQTVVEGMETECQVQMARQMGCDYAQGFFYDLALPAAEAERKWLASGSRGGIGGQNAIEVARFATLR